MFGNKVKLPPDLYERAKRHAEKAGFASVDEFVARAVEKELERTSSSSSDDEETRKRLEGLGYIS
jgi:Arc/MetJ-type ribon-helix-helix transcriptional regulator